MPSPICQVKDGSGSYVSTANGVDVTPGNTITIKLASTAGLDATSTSWGIVCIGTDELGDKDAVNAALAIDPVAREATFTAPANGHKYIFRSVVNGGVGPNKEPRADYVTTFAVCTLTAGGARVLSANETIESNSIFGWIADVNNGIRNPATGAGEVNTSSNTGAGAQVAKTKAGVDLPMRSIVGLKSTTATQQADTIELDADGVDTLVVASTGNIDDQTTVDGSSRPRSTIVFTGAAPTLRSLTGGIDKRRPLVLLANGGDLTIVDEYATAAAANRITTGTGANVTIPQGSQVTVVWDATGSRWRLSYGSSSPGTGATPGGADTQVQYHDGGTFNGNAGLTINEATNRPQMTNGFEINGDFTATITMDAEAPTANRTILFPDASTNLIGNDTADTLTNKTINTAANALVSTGHAAGDILVNDGSSYQRLAKGTDGKFLGVSSGAVGWYTPPGSGSGSPGIPDYAFQYGLSGNFVGASGLSYDATNNRPQAANGYVILYGGVKLILSAFPTTSDKTVTFQNSTHTVVGTDTVDSLSNKTINASNNSITDTGNTLGDILKSNGTKFVRFARGSALQVLRTNSGGTDLEWATIGSGLSVAGSAGEFQINNGAGGLGATSNVTGGSGYIAIGASAAATGSLRFPLGSSSVLVAGKAGAGTNDQIIGASGFNLYFGEVSPANWTTNVSGYPLNLWGYSAINFYVGSGGTTAMQISASTILSNFPRLGNSSAFASEGYAGVDMTGLSTKTLGASEYSRRYVEIYGTPIADGSDVYFPTPSGQDTNYEKIVKNSTGVSIDIWTGGMGGAFTIASGATKTLWFSGSNAYEVP